MATISLTDLTNNRIYQRNASDQRSQTITGSYTGTVTSIEARIVQNGTSTEVVTWTTIVASPSGGTFSGSITIPQGGWYNVQVRVGNETATTSNGTNAFAVGMVILTAGQSNMAYMFESSLGTSVTPNSLTRAYNAGWITVPADGARTLANKINDVTGVPVALVNTAVTSTDIASWQSGQTSYTDALSVASSAGNEFEFVLWLQGEADIDTSMSKATYRAYLDALIANLRADLDLPTGILNFVSCIVGVRPSGTGPEVRQAQYEAMIEGTNTYLGSFNIVVEMADSAHYTNAGRAQYGTWLGHIVAYINGDVSYGRGPSIVNYSVVSSTVIDVNLIHRGGTDFTPTTGITGFIVLDNGISKTISSAVRQNATTIRLTLSSAYSGALTVTYQNSNSPTVTGAVFDNSTLAFPLEFNTSISLSSPSTSVSSSISSSPSSSISSSVSSSISTSPSAGDVDVLLQEDGFSLLQENGFFIVLDAGTPSTSSLKYWNGTTWEVVNFKYWNGSTWEVATLKYWNGSTWNQVGA